MKKVYIFGVGKGKGIVETCLKTENIHLKGYIDNNNSQYKNGINGLKVIGLEEIEEFDYIVISVMNYKSVYEQLRKFGIDERKIINFFSVEAINKFGNVSFLDVHKWKTEILFWQHENKVIPYLNNVKYEIINEVQKQNLQFPKIVSSDIAIEKMLTEKVSLSRFGDGEMELISGKKRNRYQEVDFVLQERLRKILISNNEKVLIAIADVYGSLDMYTEEAANNIRVYMTEEIRREHMEVLDLEKEYYDTYISRPYVIYKDKENAKNRFEKLRSIWTNREVLIVEGSYTRMGIGNDLLDNAKSVKRILAPSEDAFSKYDDILNAVKQYGKDKVILIALGPTATVLAYDLGCIGYQALDIGHLDLEYEWYRGGTGERFNISYKYVNEWLNGNEIDDSGWDRVEKNKYSKQIIMHII